MAYKVAMPKNKENFAEVIEESREIRSSGSLLKITGESGDAGDGACRESLDTAPLCWNCNALMTLTEDIHGNPWFTCNTCAVGDGTAHPNGIEGLWRTHQLDELPLQAALELPDDDWEEWLVRYLVRTGLSRSLRRIKGGAHRRCPKCHQEKFATMVSVACDDDNCGWFNAEVEG